MHNEMKRKLANALRALIDAGWTNTANRLHPEGNKPKGLEMTKDGKTFFLNESTVDKLPE